MSFFGHTIILVQDKKASNDEKNKRYIHPNSTILHPTVHRL